jgi:hypothetical protein
MGVVSQERSSFQGSREKLDLPSGLRFRVGGKGCGNGRQQCIVVKLEPVGLHSVQLYH